MNAMQIVGVLLAIAGVVWVFLHPGAKGEGEATFANVTVKSTHPSLGLVILGVIYYLSRPRYGKRRRHVDPEGVGHQCPPFQESWH
jgi:hypothetical protein